MKSTPITASDAKDLLDLGTPVVFVDARNPTDWGQASTKLPGAIRIPADEARQHFRDVPSDATVITYCT